MTDGRLRDSGLAAKTRQVARQRRGGSGWHDAQLFAGLLAIAAGFVTAGDSRLGVPCLVLGVAAVAYQLGSRLIEPDRYYLEGFSDGLVAADQLGAAFGAAGTSDLGRVPKGTGQPDPGAVDEPAGDDQQPARRRARPEDVLDPALITIVGGLGPARALLDEEGNPTLADGPRRSPFHVPPAVRRRSPLGGPAARAQARRPADDGERPGAVAPGE